MGGAGKNILQYYTSNTGFNCTFNNTSGKSISQIKKKQQAIFKLEFTW